MSSPEWQDYLRAYEEQKRLEQYQQERILPKPKTTKFVLALYIVLCLWIVLVFFAALFLVCLAESYGRLMAIKVVECYQYYTKEEIRRKCKCVPSCSEYAILCLKKYELIYALLKIRKRLFVTCKGFDYIIDNP